MAATMRGAIHGVTNDRIPAIANGVNDPPCGRLESASTSRGTVPEWAAAKTRNRLSRAIEVDLRPSWDESTIDKAPARRKASGNKGILADGDQRLSPYGKERFAGKTDPFRRAASRRYMSPATAALTGDTEHIGQILRRGDYFTTV